MIIPLKFRYFIQISYAGTNYSGWQVQPNGLSVQQVINEKLSLKLGEKIEVTGAGRTDAGVHAEYFIAHFDTEKKLDQSFVNLMNRFLPKDIVFHSIVNVVFDAHARFSATKRTYEYRISKRKNPFLFEFAAFNSNKLDLELMNRAASFLLKVDDFTSFSKLHTENKTNICKVTQAIWEEKNDLLVFTITADRFLRNMVRAIVGTLLEVGMGKMGLNEFKQIINSLDRQKASSSAPAKGLFLTGIEYPKDIFI